MKKKFNLKMWDYLANPETKREYTEKLFTEVAPKYSTVLKYMSLFQDIKWKRHLVEKCPSGKSLNIVDVATGSGEIAFLLGEKYIDATITGLDITEEMLKIARKNNAFAHINFDHGDMNKLGLNKNSVDILTGGYALRNAPNLEVFLKDVHTSLKKGGMAAFLDFSKSPNRVRHFLTYATLKLWCGAWSLMLHGTTKVYDYIPESLKIFPDRRELGILFEKEGFKIQSRKVFLFGIAEVIVCKKAKA